MPSPIHPPEPGSSMAQTKGIGSLARKSSEVTRGGIAKMKFPTLPPRRRKTDNEASKDDLPSASTSNVVDSQQQRGRGRGRGLMRGGAPREPQQMTASGPFAMGPSAATPISRNALRSGSNASAMHASSSTSKLGTDLTRTAPPTLKSEENQRLPALKSEVTAEEYSDPEDGVQIIDMEQVTGMDWMAPDVVKREPQIAQKRLHKRDASISGKIDEFSTIGMDVNEVDESDESDDLVQYFTSLNQQDISAETLQSERLYFFQFPEPFPTFALPKSESAPPGSAMGSGSSKGARGTKRVSFASDTRPLVINSEEAMGEEASNVKHENEAVALESSTSSALQGNIGQLEIYESGAIKMRIGNVLMDVGSGTPSSFLQQIVHLNSETKRMSVIGEVNKRLVVSPDVDELLEEVELSRIAVLEEDAAHNDKGKYVIR